MDIAKVVNPEDYQVGVIVARYQVHKLTSEQRKMIDFVMSHHKKVIIFLGVARTQATRRNPMDFPTRSAMIRKHYPSAEVLPQEDNRSDEEWSKILDKQISTVFPNSKPLLYGSRDSFLPHYKGRFQTTELVGEFTEINGTELREQVSREIIESTKFRAGVIHSIYARYPQVNTTVDVCAYNDEGQILLAKKPSEDKYRFVGGFVDARDVSLEQAAYREFMEEVSGSHISGLKYILSQKVNDWRYTKEKDCILTTLFLGRYGHGQIKASDDIEDVKWFNASDFTNPEVIKRRIMPEHQEMMSKLIQKIYEGELIPNLGPFYKEAIKVVDPDLAKPSKFEVNIK